MLIRTKRSASNCTRCKLHKGRTKLVFGVGNPKAELVFVGEGPGHDEDIQGEPFVGRAGKLLTQMIEAMGLAPRRCLHLQRSEVPPARKSPPRKRRNRHLLAVPSAPTRRDPAESDLHPRCVLGANAVADHAGHFALPRRMVRLSRRQANRHLPSCLSACAIPRQGRSLERLAKGDGPSRICKPRRKASRLPALTSSPLAVTLRRVHDSPLLRSRASRSAALDVHLRAAGGAQWRIACWPSRRGAFSQSSDDRCRARGIDSSRPVRRA